MQIALCHKLPHLALHESQYSWILPLLFKYETYLKHRIQYPKKRNLEKILTLRWGMRTAIFLMIWDATPVEREKIHDTLHFEAFLKARSKKKKTNNKSPHQGLDYNTLCKISNDTEILCLYNESEEKTSKQ